MHTYDNLVSLDKQLVWHPYTQHGNEFSPIPIVKGKGASLYDSNGKEILDVISSWWTCTHGHSHPYINAAIKEQLEELEHVMFAGFTHPCAVDLAKNVVGLLPENLNKVFYSDNGSTAIEVAIKIALQYWQNKGQDKRKRIIAMEGGYHGDTFGAMSVGKSCNFYKPFTDYLFPVDFLPYPETWIGDNEVLQREEICLKKISEHLEKYGEETAAIFIEPLIQGAAGIKMCRPEFLESLVQQIRSYDILVVFDEIATGFGRTGKMFALEHIKSDPDIICLSKSITSGYLPLGATLTTTEIFDAFCADTFDKALAHGHSFAANPLACKAGIASLEVFKEEKTLEKIQHIESRHLDFIHSQKNAYIRQPRVLGTILAFDFDQASEGYKSVTGEYIRKWSTQNGFNLRPLRSTLYLMPPYCITDDQLNRTYDGIIKCLETMT